MLTQDIKYFTLSALDLNNYQNYVRDSVSSNPDILWSSFVENLSHTETLKRTTDQSTSFHKAIYSGFDKPDFPFHHFIHLISL